MDAPAEVITALDANAARNAEVVLRYLRVFETEDVSEFDEIVAEDVLVHGATSHVQGREYPAGSLHSSGLSNCRMRLHTLHAAGDRVSVAGTQTFHHDRTGGEVSMSFCKVYRLVDGVIVEFWGETDLYGLLKRIGLVPETIPAF